MKAGTTPSYKRPFWIEVQLENKSGFTGVDLVALLTERKFAQSKAEARRLLTEQCVVWFDPAISTEHTTMYDRLTKVSEATGLDKGRFFLIEPGMVICVGRTIDAAMCHRIVFK